jgi:hypothetical protein
MSKTRLHIVSLDVPFPPDYGGVIDIYYRAKSLKEAGYSIVIHCFEYGRGTNHDFSEIADEIHYYKRIKSPLVLFSLTPFIVQTRNSEELKLNLLADDSPILLEGQHCTAILMDARFSNRKIYVRIHNIEHAYYRALSKATQNLFKRLFFRLESWKLKRQEKTVLAARALFCLTTTDQNYYQQNHKRVKFWQAHFPISELIACTQQENTILYHGNLSVEENSKVVEYFLYFWKKYQIQQTLIVAGKNPSKELKAIIDYTPNVVLRANPSAAEMNEMLCSISTHLLFTFQATGVKLKLYQSLLSGARCIVNETMLSGTNLREACELVVDDEELLGCLHAENKPNRAENRAHFIKNNLSQKEQLATFFD